MNKEDNFHYPLFTRGDLSGFWALFADNLANMIIISSVLIFVFHFPDELVFGKVLPGIGIGLISGLIYYSWLAKKLAQTEKRLDVTALPYGISTPVMFVYLFGIIGPVAVSGQPLKAWQVGIAAAFIGGIVEASGSLIGPWLKKNLPRASMLGTLAGIALVYIATVPLSEVFEKPIIGFPAMAIILIGLVANQELPFKLPAGLIAIILGIVIGLFTGDAKIDPHGIAFYYPFPYIGDLISGFQYIIHEPKILGIILPIEIYNFIETMNNVESAEAAGDKYPLRKCQIMDGIGTLIGGVFGSPFPTTVYIGHPGYKRLGAGRGYALAVGSIFLIGSCFGMVAFLYKLIPIAAVAPILVFIGIVITSQAFTQSPAKHSMAVALAMIPHISNLLVNQWNSLISTIQSMRIEIPPLQSPDMIAAMLQNGIHYVGHSAIGDGAIIVGMLWGGIGAFLIDEKYKQSFITAIIGAGLTFIGIIHGLPWKLTGIFYGYIVLSALFIILWIYKKIKAY